MNTIGVNKNSSAGTSAPPIIEKTYAELLDMEGNNQLVVGQKYLMTDFQTIYDQPDYDSLGNPKIVVETKTAAVEPIILEAVSTGAFAAEVKSTLFSSDILHYDINFSQTEAMNAPAKGRITFRRDERNNECHYDSRGVRFKRYEFSLYDEDYIEYKDNGYRSSEFPTFDIFSSDNVIKKTNSYELYGHPFLLPDTIFIKCHKVEIIADYVYSNIIDRGNFTSFVSEFYTSRLSSVYNSKFDYFCASNLKSATYASVRTIFNSFIDDLYNVNLTDIYTTNASAITNLICLDASTFNAIDLTEATLIPADVSKIIYMNESGTKVLGYLNSSNAFVTANLTD